MASAYLFAMLAVTPSKSSEVAEVKIDGVLRSARRQDEQRTLRTGEGWKAEIPAPVC